MQPEPVAASPDSAPDDEEWYCRIMGNEFGPLSAEDLINIYRSGQLAPHDLVRQGATGQWFPAGSTTLLQGQR